MIKQWIVVFIVLFVAIASVSSITIGAESSPRIVNSTVQVFALGQGRAPAAATSIRHLPRHYANPDLLRQLKAGMAAGLPTGTLKHVGPPPPPPNPAPQYSGPFSALITNASFAGLGYPNNIFYEPPDTTITAGSNGAATLLLEAVNLAGQFYLTNGTASTSLSITGCTPNPSADSVSDPRVLFDSNRWFISLTTFAPVSDAGWDLIFSTTSDPSTTTWLCLHIPTGAIKNPDGSTGNFPDFPKMGINSDKLVLTGDAFSTIQRPFSTSYKFQGTEFVVINKAELLTAVPGSNIDVTVLNPPQGDFAIEPAHHLNPTSMPASNPGDNLYMAAVNSAVSSTSTIDVWTVTGLPTASTSATATVTSLPIHTISTPPNAAQKGTGVLLDTNDDSLLDAVFRDGASPAPAGSPLAGGQLWVAANDACTPAGDNTVRACPRFTEVSIASGSMSVSQDFDLAVPANYYYYPAVRTDKTGDLVAVFTGSSTSTYASVYGAMQSTSDLAYANTLKYLSNVHSGDAAYTLSPPRWGDYSGVSVDPDDSTGWIAGEYATAAACSIFPPCWDTWVASVP